MTNETLHIQEIEALPASVKALVGQAFVGMVAFAGEEERNQAARMFGEVEALGDMVTDSIAEDLRSEIAELPSELRDQPEIRALSAQLASGKLVGLSAGTIRSAIESARATAESSRQQLHAEEAAIHELRMKRDALIDQHFSGEEAKYIKEQLDIVADPNASPDAKAAANRALDDQQANGTSAQRDAIAKGRSMAAEELQARMSMEAPNNQTETQGYFAAAPSAGAPQDERLEVASVNEIAAPAATPSLFGGAEVSFARV